MIKINIRKWTTNQIISRMSTNNNKTNKSKLITYNQLKEEELSHYKGLMDHLKDSTILIYQC